MPNIKSAKKRLRQNISRNAYNVATKSKIKLISKKIDRAVADKKADDAKKELNLFFKAVDKAIVRGVIKKNTGARKKSGYAKKVFAPVAK